MSVSSVAIVFSPHTHLFIPHIISDRRILSISLLSIFHIQTHGETQTI